MRRRADHGDGPAEPDRDLPLHGLPQASRGAAAIFPAKAVTVAGETRDYTGRCFCPPCGSSVFAHGGDEIWVHPGALDAPDRFRPTYENRVVRREAWLTAFAIVRRYAQGRDRAGAFED